MVFGLVAACMAPPSGVGSSDGGGTPPPPVSGVGRLDSEAQGFLDAHNAWRHRYGTPSLVWSRELAASAQQWADDLARRGMKLEHKPDNPYGENLYWASGKRSTPREVVDAWGDEQVHYDPRKNNWWPKAGHFSQVVWRSSERLGCAVARRGSQEIWVCHYDPRGNWQGERPY